MNLLMDDRLVLILALDGNINGVLRGLAVRLASSVVLDMLAVDAHFLLWGVWLVQFSRKRKVPT